MIHIVVLLIIKIMINEVKSAYDLKNKREGIQKRIVFYHRLDRLSSLV